MDARNFVLEFLKILSQPVSAEMDTRAFQMGKRARRLVTTDIPLPAMLPNSSVLIFQSVSLSGKPITCGMIQSSSRRSIIVNLFSLLFHFSLVCNSVDDCGDGGSDGE